MKASSVSFVTCVKFEFGRGIASVVPFAVALLVCAGAAQVAFSVEAHNAGIDGVRAIDAFAYAFRGMEVFHSESRLPFIVDAYWIVPRLLVGSIACFVPVRDLKGYSAQVVTRCGSRAGWVSAKLALGAGALVLYYFSCAFFAWLNACVWASFGGVSSPDSALLLGIDPHATDASVLLALGLSFIADFSLVPLCMALTLACGAAASFASSVVVLIASAFFSTPYLWMNATMLTRSFLDVSEGLPAETVAFTCAFVLVAGITCCCQVGKKVEYR
ncbi:MAG: hypothetical protein Q4D92_01935 [Slackia sp.]|nr:hypothetical protein [Slackia sp.]